MLRFFFVFFFILSCGSVQTTQFDEVPGDRLDSELGTTFITQIRNVKSLIKAKDLEQAQVETMKILDADLNNTEKTEKYNVLGLIYYYQKRFQVAKSSFLKALKFQTENKKIKSQTILNLASTFYKIGQFQRGLKYLNAIDAQTLPERDHKKIYLLRYHISEKLGSTEEKIYSLVKLLEFSKSREEVLANKYYKYLDNEFFRLPFKDRVKVFTRFSGDRKSIAINELATRFQIDLEARGENEKLASFKSWYDENLLSDKKENVESLFQYNIFESINFEKLGVLLPMTGDKSHFAKKVMSGIDLAIEQSGANYKVVVHDSENDSQKSLIALEKMIKEEHVFAVIGGLFSKTAKDEYLMCKKHGVLYISLSPIQMERESKDRLLIEVPGSIESQVKALFTPNVMNTLGKRFALMFPRSDLGDSYLDEIWERSQKEGFELASISGYEKDQTDYRVAIGNLVGVQFSREKETELRELQKEYKKEEKDLSEIDLMKPIVEFDWVFIPSYPRKALQILPSFKYLGVKNIKFVGGPSWRSRSLLSRRDYLGEVHFVEDMGEKRKSEFINIYREKYKQEPKLLESFGFESIYVLDSLLKESSNVTSRSEFISVLRDKKSLSGYLGMWNLDQSLWLKSMMLTDLNSILN